MRDWSDILDESNAAFQRWLTDAYEAGRAAGRQEGVAGLKAKLAGLLEESPESFVDHSRTMDFEIVEAEGDGALSLTGRARPGSVKPAIANLVRVSPGLTPQEIAARTGFKFNSVRGTLWTLGNENVVESRDGKWFPITATNEAADAKSYPDTSAASITGVEDDASDQPGAQGREADDPGGGT